jgi:hypothetical protein
MSYHFHEMPYRGQEVRLVLGWEASNHTYFAFIHSCDDLESIVLVFRDEFQNAFPTLESLLHALIKHWLTPPQQMIDALSRAIDNDDPNAVVEYFSSGRSVLLTTLRAHAASTERSVISEHMASLRELAYRKVGD